MSVDLGIGETMVNIISAYAPQVSGEDEEKEIWRVGTIPEAERVIVGRDVNGDLGMSREAIERGVVAEEWERRMRKEKG